MAKLFLYIAWIQAWVATAGSLFASEVLHLPPCILCWYQRILMYPLAWILTVGIIKKDKNLAWYVLPMAILGALIAGYHNLLYWNIIPESLAPCKAGVSCTTKFFELFGFITIPFLSFMGFAVIVVSMILYLKLSAKEANKA